MLPIDEEANTNVYPKRRRRIEKRFSERDEQDALENANGLEEVFDMTFDEDRQQILTGRNGVNLKN